MKYTIGIDYGSLSGRAILVEVGSGKEIATSLYDYKDAVIYDKLPDTDIKLGHEWALQNPNDYLEVLYQTIPDVLKQGNVDKEDIIGVGIDFTSCTMMPVASDGLVLAQHEEFYNNPHAWVKLWKHHAAQPQADRLSALANDERYDYGWRYGGKLSSEWFIAKVMQIVEEAPEIYDATTHFMEATDWITMQLTGNNVRNTCTATYKAMWHKHHGFPSNEFFKELHPKMENFVSEKYTGDFKMIGEAAGTIKAEMAQKLGLSSKTIVSVGNVDAHVSAPPSDVIDEGTMLMIMGTSTCDIFLAKEEVFVEGICGVAEDGAIPGYFAYESGQSAVGDIYDWFVSKYITKEYQEEALKLDISIHQLLEQKASQQAIAQHGLLALDWWNGNRSILVDTNLSGLIIGMNLQTKPEDIYRALIEATAFGKRVIIESFKASGLPVKKLCACGGLSYKNKMLMQIYADVTNLEISIAASKQTPAYGAAMFAAVAAGSENGGYDDIISCAKDMAKVLDYVYKPIPENVEKYNKLFNEYQLLHDYFGRGENNVMKRLMNYRKGAF